MALVSKILEQTLAVGSTAVTFTDSDIANSLIRVFSSNPDIIPVSRAIFGNTLTVTYEPQSAALDVAVEIVKAGLDIVDALNSTDADKALSAKQGNMLNIAIEDVASDLSDVSDNLSDLANTVAGLVIPDNITDLDDVNITSIQDGQVLAWNDTAEKFVNVNQSSGSGINYSTTEQIIGSFMGKTLYGRIFDLGVDVSIPNNSLYTTNIDASDMTGVIDACGWYSTFVTYNSLMANISDDVIKLQTTRINTSSSIRYVFLAYIKD